MHINSNINKKYKYYGMHDNTWAEQEISQNNHLPQQKEQLITGWPESKDHIAQKLRPYWIFLDDMAVVDRVTLKGRYEEIPERLQCQALE